MSPAEIALVENAVQVRLPPPYKAALESHGLMGDEDDHPEFTTNAKRLIEENQHFATSLAGPLKPQGLLASVKAFLVYGSQRRRTERWHRWHTEWVVGQRFVIGSDLGEEKYFIVLSEHRAPVYRYELETKKAEKVAHSPAEWLAEVKRRQAETERET